MTEKQSSYKVETRGRKKMNRTDQRSNRVYRYIKEYIKDNHYPPTIREIRDAMNMSSTSVVIYYLDYLEERALINRVPRIARGIWIPNHAG